MSFYNLISNGNKNVSEILELLQLNPAEIERFRDCGINKEENFIWILARTGGSNRKEFPNNVLVDHPFYHMDHNEKFDSTYAIYYFNIPEGTDVSKFPHAEIPDLKKQTDEAIANIQKGAISPETKDFMDSLFLQIQKAMGK